MRLKQPDIFLQGSYRNSTNVRADSDVDIVVRLDYRPGRLLRSTRHVMEPPDYTWQDFRSEVLAAMVSWFGSQYVEDREKCIKVLPDNGGRAPADVVPALTYRIDPSRPKPDDGLVLFTRSQHRMIVNFPKQHRNAAIKNERTSQIFKPTVRMFKNATTHLVDLGLLTEDQAPSYCIESLLWNVPNQEFRAGTWQVRFEKLHTYLAGADLSPCKCIDGLRPLFGSAQGVWSQLDAQTWLGKMARLWNTW